MVRDWMKLNSNVREMWMNLEQEESTLTNAILKGTHKNSCDVVTKNYRSETLQKRSSSFLGLMMVSLLLVQKQKLLGS